MSKRIILFLFLTHIFISVSAQNIENWISANEKVPAEKIYIHTDGENYFHNDTIWIKVYLIDSRSGQLIPSAENVYINLLDQNGEAILKSILLAVNGQVAGNIAIPDTIKPGKFVLHAFTNYLLNFNKNAHFYKPVTISRISGYSRSAVAKDREENMVADVSFLPEGGVLLENVTNVVAFKAVSREGFGVNAKGTVSDEKGNTVTTFSTDYKGMGLLFLTPETGKSYFAKITGFPSFRYNFEPVKEGVKIQLVNHTSKEVIVNIAGNSENYTDRTFYLANMHRGEVLFYHEFTMDGINKVLKFENSSLKDGINRMVLLDNNFVPLSERLIFEQAKKVNNLMVQPNAVLYNNREEITVQVADEKYISTQDFSNLSVSVIHEHAIPKSGWNKNILSQLLIDSELNGFVESSADLFVDNDLSSDAKLRLTMLTNGWSSYFWNSAPNKTESIEFVQSGGLNLKGVAINPLSENPLQNGEITLVIQKDSEIAFLTQQTDESGNFIFPGLLFNDSALVYVQAKTETGKMNTDIILDPLFKKAELNDAQIKAIDEKVDVSGELSEMKYRSFTENRKFQQSQKSNRARSKRNEENAKGSDGHFRLYENADFVLEVDENEESFENIIDYMAGKVPGVDVNGNQVRIRGTSSFGAASSPLFLIDGIPLVSNQVVSFPSEVAQDEYYDNDLEKAEERLIQSVKTIPMNDVEKIEVLKTPTNLAVFGVKGANGVIAIYTRRGKPLSEEKNIRGVIEKKIVGYSGFRTFYSPKYLPENKDNESPDYRSTLYWNPEIKTIEGNAEIRFFSSDETGRYYIFLEGITNDGKISIGNAQFEVISVK